MAVLVLAELRRGVPGALNPSPACATTTERNIRGRVEQARKARLNVPARSARGFDNSVGRRCIRDLYVLFFANVVRTLCGIVLQGACRPQLVPRWCDDDISISYASVFTTLKVNRSWQFFVAIKGTARNSRNFLIVDSSLAVLDDGNPAPDQSNIEALPFSEPAGRFRRRSQKTIYPAHPVTGRVFDGVCFDLEFVSAAQIDATIRISGAVEFDMQLEILEFGIIDQLRTISRAY